VVPNSILTTGKGWMLCMMGLTAIGGHTLVVLVLSSPLENKVFKLFFQPANHGKISAISLQLCECFCVICIIAYKSPTTTTRQNCGNISAISLQLWECFRKSCCTYTTTLPGKLVGIFLQFRCSCGNVSASRVALTQLHYQANLWEYFCNFVAAMGMFLPVVLCLHNHTTRRSHGNVFPQVTSPPQPGNDAIGVNIR